jgi:hypothetical protein
MAYPLAQTGFLVTVNSSSGIYGEGERMRLDKSTWRISSCKEINSEAVAHSLTVFEFTPTILKTASEIRHFRYVRTVTFLGFA